MGEKFPRKFVLVFSEKLFTLFEFFEILTDGFFCFVEKIRVHFKTNFPVGFILGLFSNDQTERMILRVTNEGHLKLEIDFEIGDQLK